MELWSNQFLPVIFVLLIGGVAAQPQANGAEERPLSFVSDVLPILAKAGCSTSGCHANPEGQNGFKLSIFSYDPKADYDSIVKEGRGRRISPAVPERSLFLLKPTLQLPHEGGERITVGSEEHETLREWIKEGMVFRHPNEPTLDRISVGEALRKVKRGERGELGVLAYYADGTARDVTARADFTAGDDSFVTVDDEGRFQVGNKSGEGAIVVRYMGKVGITMLSVPPDGLLPAERYTALPINNFIDEHAVKRWAELGFLPSKLCSDSVFVRRAALDLIGTLPTSERVRSFLSDHSPDKRRHFVAELLAEPNWADRWALVWVDLLRPNPDRVGVKSVYVLDQWIRESFRQNKRYDQFARDILTVTGSTHRNGPAVVFRDRRAPADLTTSMSQIFMGVRLECARCHQHPNESWSQEDFFQFAAYFGEVGRKGTGVSPPISGSPEFVYHKPGGKVTHPVSGAVMPLKPPGGVEVQLESGRDPRQALADWMVSPENPFFARAIVNRIWGVMMGRGFVNPVDDMRTSNPPSDPALLDALAADFVAHGYDLKQLMGRIANSRVYQLSSLPNETNVKDTQYFSRTYRRRLSAEMMSDVVSDVTGVPDHFQGMPAGARALQTWNFKLGSDLLDAFGRPDSSEDCPCERNLEGSVVQALHLMHSEHLQAKLANKNGRVTKLVSSELSEAEIVEELFLTAMGRFPDKEETSLAVKQFKEPDASRQTATEDLLWALINSAEFVFNH